MNKESKVVIIVLLLIVLVCLYSFLFQENVEAETIVEDETLIVHVDNYIHIKDVNNLIEMDFILPKDEIPECKEDGEANVEVRLLVGDEEELLYGTIKVQGTSTAKYPKKNWSFKLYKDLEKTDEVYLKIGESIVSNKWILKADWKDPTQLRNYISYNLWGSMVDTRENEVLSSSIGIEGAQGYPYTHPSRVLINGKHYGIYVIVLGHDPNNFNIDKDNNKHMYFEFDARYSHKGSTSYRTWKKFKSSSIGYWIDGYYPKDEDITKKQKAAIDRLGKFINGSDKVFKNDFDKYFDKLNIIDMFLYQEVIYDWDGYAADLEMITYDLEKWYILPWDKDNTFGLYQFFSGIQKGSEEKLVMNYKKSDEKFIPWYKTYKLFTDEVEDRYAELRDKDVFSVSNIENIIDNMYPLITKKMWREEKLKWLGKKRPTMGQTSDKQIMEWFEKRLVFLDKHFNYKKED